MIETGGEMKKLLSHIQMFEEFPNGAAVNLDNYNRCLTEAVTCAHRLEEQFAGIKGQLQAREKRAKAKSAPH